MQLSMTEIKRNTSLLNVKRFKHQSHQASRDILKGMCTELINIYGNEDFKCIP